VLRSRYPGFILLVLLAFPADTLWGPIVRQHAANTNAEPPAEISQIQFPTDATFYAKSVA
jgi:hypothetical protein